MTSFATNLVLLEISLLHFKLQTYLTMLEL